MRRGSIDGLSLAAAAMLLLLTGARASAFASEKSTAHEALPWWQSLPAAATMAEGDDARNRIVEAIQRKYGARVVKVTEISVNGRRAYDLRLLSEQRVWSIRVDAESGQELSRSE